MLFHETLLKRLSKMLMFLFPSRFMKLVAFKLTISVSVMGIGIFQPCPFSNVTNQEICCF